MNISLLASSNTTLTGLLAPSLSPFQLSPHTTIGEITFTVIVKERKASPDALAIQLNTGVAKS